MEFRTINDTRLETDIRKDEDPTIQSQYSASPRIIELIKSHRLNTLPEDDIALFYDMIFNLDTAQGIGLDIWGRIVGVPRIVKIYEFTDQFFGYKESEYQPFNQAPFFNGHFPFKSVPFQDSDYREMILWKALANISTADAASLNHLLQLLFPGKEIVVRECGIMEIDLYIYFELKTCQRAILIQYGLFAKGAGVGFRFTEIPEPVFGFAEADYEPFDQAPFWLGNYGGYTPYVL